MIQRQGASIYAQVFGVDPESRALPNSQARYNGAPGQDLLVVRRDPETGARALDLLRWGLVPVWADDPKIAYKMINARSETAAKLPSFRSAFAKRRCLIPSDGFYEWKAGATSKAPKRPFMITLASGRPFAMAGLWEGWRDKASGEWLRTFTILTTSANAALTPLHARMPVILAPEDHERWLVEGGQDLLRPYPSEEIRLQEVSTRVNNVRNDDEDVMKPVDETAFPEAEAS